MPFCACGPPSFRTRCRPLFTPSRRSKACGAGCTSTSSHSCQRPWRRGRNCYCCVFTAFSLVRAPVTTSCEPPRYQYNLSEQSRACVICQSAPVDESATSGDHVHSEIAAWARCFPSQQCVILPALSSIDSWRGCERRWRQHCGSRFD